jgi:(2S)-methylsuccinyl-CoA dehydrogenase
MSASSTVDEKPAVRMSGLTAAMAEAVTAVEAYVTAATRAARASLSGADGKPDRGAFERHQHRAHGLSWVTTYLETLRQTSGWAARLEADGKFGDIEALLCQVLFGEYCAQLIGGIPMNQGEMVRPADLGCQMADMQLLFAAPIQRFINQGKTPEVMAAAAALLPDALSRNTAEFTGLDETMEMVRDQFAKFASTRIKPFAHGWHLRNDYIPMDVVGEMAELGVFGLTIPEEYRRPRSWARRRCASSPRSSRAGGSAPGRSAPVQRNRRGADPDRRHRRSRRPSGCQSHRLRRDPADRRLHRAEHRVGPRLAAHARREVRRRTILCRHRQQDLDHASRCAPT